MIPDNAHSTSTYLLRQGWVKNFERNCMARGDHYTIEKSVGGWVSIDKLTQFSSVAKQLQYLADNKTTKKQSTFCVIGQKDGAYLAAYVVWKTENQLFMWFPDKEDANDPYAVADSDVQIDLTHGLRNDEDAADEENEMQPSYARSIVQACLRFGQKFEITKSGS